jgi:hypothetical protein
VRGSGTKLLLAADAPPTRVPIVARRESLTIV